MEIVHIEQFAFSLLYPVFSLVPLTFGAMPVTTAIVAQVKFPAIRVSTPIDMASHSGRPTSAEGVEGAQFPGVGCDGGKVF